MPRRYGERNYPKGVDPKKVDEFHNAKGERSPYSEHQRKQAAARIRTLEQEGWSHEAAIDRAFEEIGDPEHPLGEMNPDDMSDFQNFEEGPDRGA